MWIFVNACECMWRYVNVCECMWMYVNVIMYVIMMRTLYNNVYCIHVCALSIIMWSVCMYEFCI